jgi:E3 ubiquitin-protein ligase UBR4
VQIGGGGVSIYYSHSMQLLVFSYANGKSFMAPVKSVCEEIDLIFPINVTKASSAGSGGGKNGAHPLCQWSEIPGHPGLVTAFLQSSNNPVILMVKPETICAQEIKVGSKSKIADMVAIRYKGSDPGSKPTYAVRPLYVRGIDRTTRPQPRTSYQWQHQYY